MRRAGWAKRGEPLANVAVRSLRSLLAGPFMTLTKGRRREARVTAGLGEALGLRFTYHAVEDYLLLSHVAPGVRQQGLDGLAARNKGRRGGGRGGGGRGGGNAAWQVC